MAVSAHATESGQNGSKPGQNSGSCTNPGTENLAECYWHCSDGTVHYKSDKTVNFCGFRCATTSPINRFYKRRFLHLLH